MIKILLVNAPPLKAFGVVGQIYPPLGILYLASYLRAKRSDCEISVIDGYREKDVDAVIKRIAAVEPDILGVSFTTQAATGAYAVIAGTRERLPGVFIVAGGPHPSIYPDEPLIRANADLAVRGEGEVVFSNIVDRVSAGTDCTDLLGVAFRRNGVVKVNPPEPLIQNLDAIPFPARDLIDLSVYPGYHYKQRAWDTSYLSGRGCPYQCVYCSNPVWKLQKPWIRLRSPKNIVDEIAELKSTYGVTEFYDQTDLFNASIGWAKSVCDEMISRDLGIAWKVQMTTSNVDDELAAKMVQSGCWLGVVGIETGNDDTAKGINKRTSRDTAERAVTILKRHGMKTFALLMAFNVWEENDRLVYEDRTATLETLRFAKGMIKKGLIDIVSWSLTTPYPGSKLFDIAERHHLIPDNLRGQWERWDSSENVVMRLPGVSDKDWADVKWQGKILQAFLLVRSGTFNWHSMPIYMKKLVRVLWGRLRPPQSPGAGPQVSH